jgi:hypothetical protein
LRNGSDESSDTEDDAQYRDKVKYDDEKHQAENTVTTDDQPYSDKDCQESNKDCDRIASHSDNDDGAGYLDRNAHEKDQDH